jgi:signal transduction histidine kinase
MTQAVPALLRQRRWWLLLLGAWAGAVGISLLNHLADLRQHSLDVASEGIRKVFHMVVLTRAWNASHGPVYLPVSDKVPANPYLEHPRRDVTTTDGQRLTLVNPAYMTRQIAELAFNQGELALHITSLRPIRPLNRADAWEDAALQAFEEGARERIEVVQGGGGGQLLRFMAPLPVDRSCLACHAKQGYQVGDIRGGISITLPYARIEATLQPLRRQEYLNHALVLLLAALVGWVLLEVLRQRWLDLAQHVDALQTTRDDLEVAIGDLARARDEAEAASRAKSAFLTTMSHEFRTPLNAILGLASLLRGSTLPTEQQAHVEAMRQAGNNLLTLVNEVFDYTRMEAEPPVGTSQAFDPARLLGELSLRYHARAAAKGLRLTVDGGSGAPVRLVGPVDHILRILAKLVDNAIKFTERGSVMVGLAAEPLSERRVRLRLVVADTGIGMDADTLARLFHPFEIVDSATNRRHAGIGLGLAICKRLADAMGGRIEVASTPGTGSAFTLTVELERAGGHATGSAPPIDAGGLARLIALLEVDDIQAAEAYAEQAAGLRTLLGERFAEFDRLMAGFDYAAAASLLGAHRAPD